MWKGTLLQGREKKKKQKGVSNREEGIALTCSSG